MSNFEQHRKINYLGLFIILGLGLYFNLELDYKFVIIFIGSYILGTEIFSPDIDTRSKPGKRLGIFSIPLRKLSTHRGLVHNVFIGWLLIVIYFMLIFTIILIVAYGLGYDFFWILKYIDKENVSAFLIGIFLSSVVHKIADWLKDNGLI